MSVPLPTHPILLNLFYAFSHDVTPFIVFCSGFLLNLNIGISPCHYIFQVNIVLMVVHDNHFWSVPVVCEDTRENI